jgi:hypothetical protein
VIVEVAEREHVVLIAMATAGLNAGRLAASPTRCCMPPGPRSSSYAPRQA